MGSWNPTETAESRSSASNKKSIELQTHGAQIWKGSSTCPKLLSYHAITLPPHQLFHLTDTFTCSTSNLIYCIICCKCSNMYVGQTSKTLRDRFHHHRAAAKEKRSWPLPHYRSRLQQRCVDPTTWTLSSPTGQWHMVVVLLVQDYSYDYGGWESTRNSGSCFHSKGYMILSDAKIFYVKHRWESGCQANQQQSFRFLKGLSAGKECAVPLPES